MYDQMKTEEVCQALGQGLTAQEAAARLRRDGPNKLTETKKKTRLSMFLAQLRDPLIYILFGAAAVSIAVHEAGDAAIILCVVLLNAVIGTVQEGKAQDSLEALKKLSSPTAVVRRDGKAVEISAEELVKGDLVLLEAGRTIPADLRLTTSASLKIEESALTGESVPVEKDADFVAAGELPLGDRINMAYLSTAVTYGRGEGLVTAVGMETELGRIAGMVQAAGNEVTPLQRRLADLGKLLGILAVVLCGGLFALAVWQGRPIGEMLLTAISLAVAAVPEGLAAVVTIVLALGVQRLVAVGTIVKRLPSVETLGAVSVVCSDKTGTLTQNRMAVTEYWPEKSEILVRGMMLCNDASTEGGARYGDPTELALLDMGVPLTRPELEKDYPRIGELPFDSDRKRMTTLHMAGNTTVSFTKGSIEGILDLCIDMPPARRAEIEAAAASMSSKALRVLALAVRSGDEVPVEADLEFVGLVGMIDPPRPEAAAAVASFKRAGVRTVMITGDHPDTAFAIAKELGIAEDISQCMTGAELELLDDAALAARIETLRVFARVSPTHKVKIVDALRAKGHIVSMTGDGVNDAPSLKMADIGVSMGITGTDVARSASDMVLSDDNFATIERAISEGRGIYANIKKSVLFLLSSNFGEIITMTAAIAAGLAAPLRAIHILWVNLITDSLPGLALGIDRHDTAALMRRPPRDPAESLFAGGGLFTTLFYGVLVAGCTLFAFTEGLQISTATGQTYAFTVLGISQLFHAVGMRDVTKSIFRMSHTSNPLMIFSFAMGLALQVAVTEIPFLIRIFDTVRVSPEQWLRLFALSAVPLVAHELLLPIQRRLQSKK